MSSYVLPQVQVFQIFNQLPGSVTQNMNAFVFGPQYQLFRYGVASEKALASLGQYNYLADTVLGWPSQPAGSVPDTSYAALYGDNVWARYLALAPSDGAEVTSEDARNEIRVPNVVLKTANGYTRSGLLLRDVRVGDCVQYSYTDLYDVTVSGSSRIVALLPDVSSSTRGPANPKASNTGPQTSEDVVSGGTYTGPANTTYQVKVLRGGVFTRTASAEYDEGNSIHTTMTLTANPGAPAAPDWTKWLGGDINDTYTLTCTTGGGISAARFSLTSVAGDTMTGIDFASSANAVAIGNRGLYAAMTGTGTFTQGDSWTITVLACRPQIQITDASGIDTSSTFVATSGVAYNVGSYNVTVTFESNGYDGLTTGDVFNIAVTASAPSAIYTVVLADDVAAGIPAGIPFSLSFFLTQNAAQITSRKIQVPGQYNWTADPVGGITVKAAIAVQDPSWRDLSGEMPWLPVVQADLFMQYRALILTNAQDIQSISDISEVVTTLGTVHPDNPLAQGVFNALQNSGSQAVYFIGIPSVDATGWAYALSRAELTSSFFSMVPLTQDADVKETVVAHVNEMSGPSNKRWRVAFVGQGMLTQAPVYTQANNLGGASFLAEISVDAITGLYTILKFVNQDGSASTTTRCTTEVKAGDTVLTSFATDAWGAVTSVAYRVASVMSNNTLKLVAGPASAVDTPSKTEVWHPYTIQETAEAIAAASSNYYNRRVYNCFPSTLGSNGVLEGAEFGAAAIAGLVSSVPPQQPITNIAVAGFDDLPLVYRTFTAAQLNTIAGGGTLIIMQDQVGGLVYVRHQVSTAASGGDLNQTELSLVKNLDSISYYFAARFKPYVGRYNITPQFLSLIYTVIQDGINYLGSLTDVGTLGPQLDLTKTEIVGVQQHPTLKDHVIATVNLGLPAPFNVLQLNLVV